MTATRNYQALTESAPWRLHMALIATLGSTRSGEARKQIAAALEEAQLRSRESMVALFGYLMAEIGLRLRDPAWTTPSTCSSRAACWCSRWRCATSRSRRPTARSRPAGRGDRAGAAQRAVPGPGLNGETAEWTLVGYAYLGLVDGFVELDPDFTPPRLSRPR